MLTLVLFCCSFHLGQGKTLNIVGDFTPCQTNYSMTTNQPTISVVPMCLPYYPSTLGLCVQSILIITALLLSIACTCGEIPTVYRTVPYRTIRTFYNPADDGNVDATRRFLSTQPPCCLGDTDRMGLRGGETVVTGNTAPSSNAGL